MCVRVCACVYMCVNLYCEGILFGATEKVELPAAAFPWDMREKVHYVVS